MKPDCLMSDCDRVSKVRGLCAKHYRRLQRYGDPTHIKRTIHTGTDSERFWKRVDKSAGCWVWGGRMARNGYGMYSLRDKGVVAHRFAYIDAVSAIPDGLQVDHMCHNRACVNPSHLRLVTNKQNNENPAGLRADNTSGHRGVTFDKRVGRWYAKAQHEGQTHSAGGYATREEAAEAARQLRLSLFTHNDADRNPRSRKGKAR